MSTPANYTFLDGLLQGAQGAQGPQGATGSGGGGEPAAIFYSAALAADTATTLFTATVAGFYDLYVGGKSTDHDSTGQLILTAVLHTTEVDWTLGTLQQANFEGSTVINNTIGRSVYLRVGDSVVITSAQNTALVMYRITGPLSES